VTVAYVVCCHLVVVTVTFSFASIRQATGMVSRFVIGWEDRPWNDRDQGCIGRNTQVYAGIRRIHPLFLSAYVRLSYFNFHK